MPELIVPGVYIEVRPEGLIVPTRVGVGNIGIVGTASRGPVLQPILLGSYADAQQNFGTYDAWVDGNSNELTLVRALELAYDNGATTVFAVRVAGSSAAAASFTIISSSGNNVQLQAKAPGTFGNAVVLSPGTWGNALAFNVWDADQPAIIKNETVSNKKLAHNPVVQNASNRIQVNNGANSRVLKIIYSGTPQSDQVLVDISNDANKNGTLTFGQDPAPGDTVKATYAVDKSKALKVTLSLGRRQEVYTVVNGQSLADAINDPNTGSAWVTAKPLANAGEALIKSKAIDEFTPFSGGDDGASNAVYQGGLDALLQSEAHIIIAAGQDDTFGNALDRHCQLASTDTIKHDRIAIVGSRVFAPTVTNDSAVNTIAGHNIDSDRVAYLVPGIKQLDAGANPPIEVTLPGAYTAAAAAGLLSSLPPHISLTNKVLPVDDLERKFNATQITQLLEARVIPLESRQGFHIVRGITTSTNTAWRQITTRRIVDYAKFGVRSAADPYIGLLNNERVRGALRTTINSFLAEMVNDEMLISYKLDVTATRDQEIQGIVQVTMTLSPVFSIDFIVVTMFLG